MVFFKFRYYNNRSFPIRQGKNTSKAAAFLLPPDSLPLTERFAVSALILGGVGLMGTHQDPVQRAVIFAVAVVSTGLDGAFDALICMAVHVNFLLLFGLQPQYARRNSVYAGNGFQSCFCCEFVILFFVWEFVTEGHSDPCFHHPNKLNSQWESPTPPLIQPK